jgi:hypothetical protein
VLAHTKRGAKHKIINVVLRVFAFVLTLMAINHLKGEQENSKRRKAENLRQRKETLFKKAHRAAGVVGAARAGEA